MRIWPHTQFTDKYKQIRWFYLILIIYHRVDQSRKLALNSWCGAIFISILAFISSRFIFNVNLRPLHSSVLFITSPKNLREWKTPPELPQVASCSEKSIWEEESVTTCERWRGNVCTSCSGREMEGRQRGTRGRRSHSLVIHCRNLQTVLNLIQLVWTIVQLIWVAVETELQQQLISYILISLFQYDPTAPWFISCRLTHRWFNSNQKFISWYSDSKGFTIHFYVYLTIYLHFWLIPKLGIHKI